VKTGSSSRRRAGRAFNAPSSYSIKPWQRGLPAAAARSTGGAAFPAWLIIDTVKSAITRACMYAPQVQRSDAELAGGYGFKIDACPPHDPRKKGTVESGVKSIKKSFLPLRTFLAIVDTSVMDEAIAVRPILPARALPGMW
jgi:transposase